MKIKKIQTLVCHARMRNWVFVRVVTDEPGLYGWGEATLEWHTRAIVGDTQTDTAIADLEKFNVDGATRRRKLDRV